MQQPNAAQHTELIKRPRGSPECLEGVIAILGGEAARYKLHQRASLGMQAWKLDCQEDAAAGYEDILLGLAGD